MSVYPPILLADSLYSILFAEEEEEEEDGNHPVIPSSAFMTVKCLRCFLFSFDLGFLINNPTPLYPFLVTGILINDL